MVQPLNLTSLSITFGFNASQQSQQERSTGCTHTVQSLECFHCHSAQIQQRRLDLQAATGGRLTTDKAQTHGAGRTTTVNRWKHLDWHVKLIKPLVCPASPMTRRSRRTPKHNVPSARICEIPPFQNNPKSSRVVEMEATPTGP